MKNNSVKQDAYEAQKPVTIERDVNDVIVIEGVRYSGDVFRNNLWPKEAWLYAIRKREDDTVWITEIHNVEEAVKFFEQAGREDPAPTNNGGA